jgi:hypothetical protein
MEVLNVQEPETECEVFHPPSVSPVLRLIVVSEMDSFLE